MTETEAELLRQLMYFDGLTNRYVPLDQTGSYSIGSDALAARTIWWPYEGEP